MYSHKLDESNTSLKKKKRNFKCDLQILQFLHAQYEEESHKFGNTVY